MQGRGRNCQIVLSKRLQMLADMVTPGNRLVDVGCDHGFLAIYLVERKICPGAIAMDVRKGPLAGAGEHIKEFGLGEYIETRLSDGLTECAAGEADTLVCAGMGGRLMESILRDGMEKAGQMKELILQPQSELPRFRAFLRSAGFSVTEEDAVFEDGKYYFAMKAIPMRETAGHGQGTPALRGEEEECGFYDLFGKCLLTQRHPVLFQYLRQRERYIRKLEASLASSGTEKARVRLEEVRGELRQIRKALSFYDSFTQHQ